MLCARPEVLKSRIGAGGALTMYSAALDTRIQVTLVHSYLSKYVVTPFDEEHCPCNDIPGIRWYADMGHEFDNQLAIGCFRRWLSHSVDLSGCTSCLL